MKPSERVAEILSNLSDKIDRDAAVIVAIEFIVAELDRIQEVLTMLQLKAKVDR